MIYNDWYRSHKNLDVIVELEVEKLLRIKFVLINVFEWWNIENLMKCDF
jgi:hypothetical protein